MKPKQERETGAGLAAAHGSAAVALVQDVRMKHGRLINLLGLQKRLRLEGARGKARPIIPLSHEELRKLRRQNHCRPTANVAGTEKYE